MHLQDIENILIKPGEFLKDIVPFKKTGIPTDIIFFKTLTGCGATSLEIEWARNSLIIVPNVPVIIGKKKKHKRILGIYEKTSTDEIEEYLESDILYKKIIVTPESFYRIKDAIGPSIYDDYFLLMDECERTIQDVRYRSNIILPMFDFFKFKKKAFMSATPIIPSDPRFKKNEFSILKLTPSFDHRQPITLINTNNIIQTLKKFLEDHPRDKYFFFFNSTDNIADIITKLDLKRESAIYCSRDSRKKLRLNDYTHVYTELHDFKKYNFLTSRFYSAVDIDYELHESDPTIVMLTDLVFAPHSMIDPQSEAVQIVGRFRKSDNVKFKKEIFHITNTAPDLQSMSKTEVLEYIKESHVIYRVIKRFYLSVTKTSAKETLKQMLERIDYSQYLNKHDGSRNHYMIDNLIYEEKVKGCFRSLDKLVKAYRKSGSFEILKTSSEQYAYTDKNRLENRTHAPLKSLTRIVGDAIKELHSGKYTEFQIQLELANLQLDFPNIMVAVNKIGLDEASKLDYNLHKIKAKLNEREERKDHFGLMTFIKENFIPGVKYTSQDIETTLTIGIKKLGLTGLLPGPRLLRKFCDLSENRVYIRRNAEGEEIRGYLLLKICSNQG